MSDRTADAASRKDWAAARHEFAIYKPTRANTGGVLRLSLAADRPALFLDAAVQKGEKAFDWQSKITMKWGLSDIGEVLAVLERRQEEAKLFHHTERQSTTFHIRHQGKEERRNYFAQVTKQLSSTKELTKVGVPISQGEAAVLATLLRSAAVRLAGW